MTKAGIASAVNEWFNIENYSVLQNLTVEQLFQEIENRIVAYRMGQNSGELPPESRRRHQNYYEELIEGKVVFGDVFGGQKKDCLPAMPSSLSHIRGYGRWRVMWLLSINTLTRKENPYLIWKSRII